MQQYIQCDKTDDLLESSIMYGAHQEQALNLLGRFYQEKRTTLWPGTIMKPYYHWWLVILALKATNS